MLYTTRLNKMKCRYCGDTLRTINQKLFSTTGVQCLGTPAGIHVGVTDGECCVYCGDKTHCQNRKLITHLGDSCRNSPTRMHCLQ